MAIKHDSQSGFKPCFASGIWPHRQNSKQQGRQKEVGLNGLDNRKF